MPYRLPGRPRVGVDDSPYLCDGTPSVLCEWLVHQIGQLPPEKDPQRARDMFLFQRYIRSWGEEFARQVAAARVASREIR